MMAVWHRFPKHVLTDAERDAIEGATLPPGKTKHGKTAKNTATKFVKAKAIRVELNLCCFVHFVLDLG